MIEKAVSVVVGTRTATIARVTAQVDGFFVFDLFDAEGIVAKGRYAPALDCPFVLTQAEIDAAVLAASNEAEQLGVDISALANAFTVTTQTYPPLNMVQQEANKRIDEQAGKTRLKYITDVAGQSETYLLKYDDAVAYVAAGYPSASIASYQMVQAEAKALYGATPSAAQYQAAADYIIATQAQWKQLCAAIEQQRRAGKEAVSAALTVSEVQSAEQAAFNALGAL